MSRGVEADAARAADPRALTAGGRAMDSAVAVGVVQADPAEPVVCEGRGKGEGGGQGRARDASRADDARLSGQPRPRTSFAAFQMSVLTPED